MADDISPTVFVSIPGKGSDKYIKGSKVIEIFEQSGQTNVDLNCPFDYVVSSLFGFVQTNPEIGLLQLSHFVFCDSPTLQWQPVVCFSILQ